MAAPNLKGKELKDEIDRFVKAFYNETKESNFGVVGSTLKNILEKLELSLKEEINPGLGTLNRLFMASELLHLQKKKLERNKTWFDRGIRSPFTSSSTNEK